MSVKKMINGELVTLAGAQLQQVFTGTEAEIEAALQAGTIPEGALINSLDDGDDPELTSSMILHGNDSVENVLNDISTDLSNFKIIGSVTADGIKTCAELLSELYHFITSDKCKLKIGNYYFNLTANTNGVYEFTMSNCLYGTAFVITNTNVASTQLNCTRIQAVLTADGITINNETSRVFDAGIVFSIVN